MKAIVVGTGAGGATSARELQSKGFDVIILEAGKPFKPFSRQISWTEPLRRLGLLGSEKNFRYLFPAMHMQRSAPDLILVRGITSGGSTVLSCGNLVRTENGLKEIGLDLSQEFKTLEQELSPQLIPQSNWRPVTKAMFRSAEELGLQPQPTPKAVDVKKCKNCGLCELGCKVGARWDSRKFLYEAKKQGAKICYNSPVEKVLNIDDKIEGVSAIIDGKKTMIKADLVVLAAGGIGTPQILKKSGFNFEDKLWADIVLTLGGISPGSHQLHEPPMVWYTKHPNFILSPYLDILSHFFHKPWRKVPIRDRVGLMVKLADMEQGSVGMDGSVTKELTNSDQKNLKIAIEQAQEVMEKSGVSGPFIEGVHNGGHLGGSVPLVSSDLDEMKPSWLPEGLWVADLSLAPRSQGMPTMLLTAALAMRVSNKIWEKYKK